MALNGEKGPNRLVRATENHLKRSAGGGYLDGSRFIDASGLDSSAPLAESPFLTDDAAQQLTEHMSCPDIDLEVMARYIVVVEEPQSPTYCD